MNPKHLINLCTLTHMTYDKKNAFLFIYYLN